MSKDVVLVTGASRGIGHGLVSKLLERSDTTVIAAVRTLTDETRQKLETLPKGSGSKVIVIKIDVATPSDAEAAAKDLKSRFSISRIDTVIANAGISKFYGPAAATPLEEMTEHFAINAVGPLALFQAFWPLLQQSDRPKFVAMTTGLASITQMQDFPLPITAYGTSKAAMNYIVRKIHFENEALAAFVISPGWVQTDMGNSGAVGMGMEEAPVTLKDSVDGILDKVDKATREAMGGVFASFDGTKFAW